VALRDHKVISRGITQFFYFILALSIVITPSNAEQHTNRQNRNGNIDLEFQSDPPPPHCINAQITDTDSLLECVREDGYVYAVIEDSLGIGVPRLILGQRVHTASLQVSDELQYLTPNFILSLGTVEIGGALSPAKYQNLAYIVQEEQIANNVSFEFFPDEFGSAEVLMTGSEPSSSLQFGIHFGATEGASGSIFGRHFANFIAPGYLNYNLTFNDIGKVSRGYLSAPLSYSRHNRDRLEISYDQVDDAIFGSEVLGIGFNRRYYGELFDFFSLELEQTHFKISEQNFRALSVTDHDVVTSASVMFATDFGRDSSSLRLNFGVFHSAERQNAWARSDISYGRQTVTDPQTETFWGLMARSSTLWGDFTAIPPLERLYVGGVSSVRGVRPQELGLRSQITSDFGGSSSLSLQGELGRSFDVLNQNLTVGAHIDAGALHSEGVTSDALVTSGLFIRDHAQATDAIELSLSRPFAAVDTGWRLDFTYRHAW
jgi:hypothetical protein